MTEAAARLLYHYANEEQHFYIKLCTWKSNMLGRRPNDLPIALKICKILEISY